MKSHGWLGSSWYFLGSQAPLLLGLKLRRPWCLPQLINFNILVFSLTMSSKFSSIELLILRQIQKQLRYESQHQGHITIIDRKISDLILFLDSSFDLGSHQLLLKRASNPCLRSKWRSIRFKVENILLVHITFAESPTYFYYRLDSVWAVQVFLFWLSDDFEEFSRCFIIFYYNPWIILYLHKRSDRPTKSYLNFCPYIVTNWRSFACSPSLSSSKL